MPQKVLLDKSQSYMRATQDPPQQVIDDCTKEVDEALRQVQ